MERPDRERVPTGVIYPPFLRCSKILCPLPTLPLWTGLSLWAGRDRLLYFAPVPMECPARASKAHEADPRRGQREETHGNENGGSKGCKIVGSNVDIEDSSSLAKGMRLEDFVFHSSVAHETALIRLAANALKRPKKRL